MVELSQEPAVEEAEGPPSEDASRRHAAILAAVAVAAQRLLEAPIDASMNDVLGVLGEATGASRAYVFAFREEDGELRSVPRYEWAAPGIQPTIASGLWDDFRFGSHGFLDFLAAFRRGEVFQATLSELPPLERKMLESEGTRSILEAPILVDGEIWGDFGLDDCTRERRWLPVEVDAIRAAAAILGAALGRARADDRLRDSHDLLRQAQKMEAIGRLAGGVAHDFNNLLTVITGFCGLLLDRLAPDDPSRHDVEQIAEAGERAVAVTGQLLAFSRRQLLQPQPVDLNTVVAETEGMLRRLIGEDVALVTRLQAGVGIVYAEPGQIEQIIVNLVVNARDAMPAGGRIEIATGLLELGPGNSLGLSGGAFATLTVSDGGVGMDSETRSRIFEPFFTTKEAGKGTGLGLATVYGIVAQSGGGIAVESAPGEGTTFIVYLPVPTPREVASPVPDVVELTGSHTILLAEDEDIVRELVTAILEQRGYNVLAAADGEGALSVAAAFPERIDLLVTDVVMPRRGGRELATALVTERPEVKVLFMSGYTDDAAIRRDVLDVGIPFLQKPFSADELAEAVMVALNRA
jgi:signal transduction histidine kinase/ActR/RegA family two-component response regulator